jgi:hypothetical protein
MHDDWENEGGSRDFFIGDALEDICMRSKPNIRLERFKNAQAW